jgi:hypothetical protein
MKKIKEVIFTDGSIGEYWATDEWVEGFPSASFFWKGDDCPTRLCLDWYDYAYTHGGKIFRQACEAFPKGFSQF